MSPVRLFVSFPEALVGRPLIYELVKQHDVVPNIRRANVESHSGWIILELGGEDAKVEAAIAFLAELGCTVNPMQGDVLES